MVTAIRKYGDFLNFQDVLKFAAIVLMVVDHVGNFFYPEALWLRVLGRLCIPIWFFFVGYSLSQKIDKPIILGMLLLIGFRLAIHAPVFPINILGTIIICRLVHRYFLNDYLEKPGFGIMELMLLALLILLFEFVTQLFIEYGALAFLFTIIGRLMRIGRKKYDTHLFIMVSGLLFVLAQAIHFNFSWEHTIALGAGIAAMIMLLYTYSPKEFRWTYHNPAAWGIMLLARHSLYFYVLHLLLLLALHRVLYPESYQLFTWIKM